MKIDTIKQHGILIVITIVAIIFAVVNPVFLTSSNLVNIIVQSSVTIVLAIGMSFVVLIGGIDLSVGSVAAFASVAIAALLTNNVGLPASLVITMLLVIILGLVSGLMINKAKIQPFIATLAMMGIARGIALLISGGKSISISESQVPFSDPQSIMIFLIIYFVIAWTILHKTVWGTHIYAIGSHRMKAWLSGINVKKYEIMCYVISAFSAGIAGLIVFSRLGSAQPTIGNLYELDAISAVIIGGISLVGGRGKVIGVLWASLMLGTIANGLSILNVPSYVQLIVTGGLLLLAIVFDNLNRGGYSENVIKTP